MKIKLEKENFIVYLANNGQEAVDFIEKNNVDIIFMDLVMPILNGIDAVKQIRNNKYKGIIVGLSGNENRINDYKEYGFDYFLLKPIDYTSINNYINKILN